MSSATLPRAIASIRSGDQGAGKPLLAEVICDDPGNETAWLWMSATVDSDQQRRTCLERVLAPNPHHETARRGLEALSQQQVEQPPPPEKQPQPTPPAATDAIQAIRQLDPPDTQECPYKRRCGALPAPAGGSSQDWLPAAYVGLRKSCSAAARLAGNRYTQGRVFSTGGKP